MEKSNNRIFGGDLKLLGEVIRHYIHVAQTTENLPSSGNIYSGAQAKLISDETIKNHMNKANSLQKLYDTYVEEEISKSEGVLISPTVVEKQIVKETVIKNNKPVTKANAKDNKVVMEVVHNSKKVLESTEEIKKPDLDEVILSKYVDGKEIIPVTVLEQISNNYSTKGAGVIIEGEITEEDRKNASSLDGSIVIEKRGHEEKSYEIKRNKSGKELAIAILSRYITSMGDDISGVSAIGLRKAASRLASNYNYTKKVTLKDDSLNIYSKLELPKKLNSFTLKTAKELVKLRKKFIVNGSFNMEVLVNRSINKKMSSEDMLILQVTQLVASKQFNKCVDLIIKYFKEKGIKEMNVDLAYLYINELMAEKKELNADENKEIITHSPYDSLKSLIDTLLLADPKDHLKYINTAIELIQAYSTNTFIVKLDGKDILKSNCWDNHRVVKMINKRINYLVSENKLTVVDEKASIALLTSNHAGIVPVSKIIEPPLLPLKADKVVKETKSVNTEINTEVDTEKVITEPVKDVIKPETKIPSKPEVKGSLAPSVKVAKKVAENTKKTETVKDTVSKEKDEVKPLVLKVNFEYSPDKKLINFNVDELKLNINNNNNPDDEKIKKAIKGKLLGYISGAIRNNEKAKSNNSIKEKLIPESLKNFNNKQKLEIELISKAV